MVQMTDQLCVCVYMQIREYKHNKMEEFFKISPENELLERAREQQRKLKSTTPAVHQDQRQQ